MGAQRASRMRAKTTAGPGVKPGVGRPIVAKNPMITMLAGGSSASSCAGSLLGASKASHTKGELES
jgi:hypothetical protein